MDPESAARLYKIQNDTDHYFTGRLSNGNQVLTGSAGTNSDGEQRQTPTFPLVEFDKDGTLLGVYTEETGAPFRPLRFTPGTISVKQFFLPEHWLGITDLPEHYREFLDHPENAGEDERLYYPDQIAEWRANGDFVLCCDEDYYLNEEGELVSS